MPDPDLDALKSLRRLRHAETGAARRALGEALTRETALQAQHDAIGRELDAVRQTSGEFDREALAAFLRRALTERSQLADDLREAASRAASARTELAHRRVAETIAGEALAAAQSTRRATAAKREQMMLEDVARVVKRTKG